MRVYLTFASVLVIAFAMTLLSAGARSGRAPETPTPETQPESMTNRLIIKYREDSGQNGKMDPAGADRMRSLNSAAGVDLEYLRAMSDDAHILQLPDRLSASRVEEITARIAALPDVEYAEPDYILLPALMPNDPYYGSQWNYFDANGINAPAAWDITTGSSDIKIAVIDSGITNHADLAGQWTGGYDFISDALIANDGDGRDGDPHDPGDWVTSAESASGFFKGCGAEDSSWHGTHVAGTIGASANNGMGVAGVNWNSLIIPVRALGKCGGYLSDIAEGMRWAAGLTVTGVPPNSNPAKVINLSLGGSGSCGSTFQNAINAVNAAGSVVVVAAGNSNLNLDLNNFQPANCSGVITVAATDRGGDRAFYSNFGSTVEISAPGGESGTNGVLSTINSGTTIPVSDSYAYYAGTSMAAPHVAGVVSLMFSLDPTLTPAEVVQILQSTSRPFPAGSGCTTSTCGSGIVNAAGALNAVLASLLPDLIITNVVIAPPIPPHDEPFDVIITIKNQGGSTGFATIYRDIYFGVDPMTILDPVTGCPPPGDYFRSDVLNLGPGQTDTRIITITNGLPKGSYQLWAYVDARCLVTEMGEANNGP